MPKLLEKIQKALVKKGMKKDKAYAVATNQFKKIMLKRGKR